MSKPLSFDEIRTLEYVRWSEDLLDNYINLDAPQLWEDEHEHCCFQVEQVFRSNLYDDGDEDSDFFRFYCVHGCSSHPVDKITRSQYREMSILLGGPPMAFAPPGYPFKEENEPKLPQSVSILQEAERLAEMILSGELAPERRNAGG